MRAIATPANTMAYRSFFSNQPLRGSWCERCHAQPKPCITYLCATMENTSIRTTVRMRMRALDIMAPAYHTETNTHDPIHPAVLEFPAVVGGCRRIGRHRRGARVEGRSRQGPAPRRRVRP